MEIPDSVKWLSWIVGADWPEGDETAMRRVAEGWTTAGGEVRNLIDDLGSVAFDVVSTLDGYAAERFRAHWDTWVSTDPQRLTKLADACDQLAKVMNDGATDIEYAKYMFIALLIITAIEIIMLIYSAFATFGASTAAIPAVEAGAQIASRTIFQRLLSWLARNVIIHGAVMGALEGGGLDLLIQGIQVAQGNRDGINWGQTLRSTVDGAIGGAISGGVAGGLGKIPGVDGAADTALGSTFKGAVREGASEAISGVAGTVASAAIHGESLSWEDIAKGATSGAAGGAIGGARGGLGEFGSGNAGGGVNPGGSDDGGGSNPAGGSDPGGSSPGSDPGSPGSGSDPGGSGPGRGSGTGGEGGPSPGTGSSGDGGTHAGSGPAPGTGYGDGGGSGQSGGDGGSNPGSGPTHGPAPSTGDGPSPGGSPSGPPPGGSDSSSGPPSTYSSPGGSTDGSGSSSPSSGPSTDTSSSHGSPTPSTGGTESGGSSPGGSPQPTPVHSDGGSPGGGSSDGGTSGGGNRVASLLAGDTGGGGGPAPGTIPGASLSSMPSDAGASGSPSTAGGAPAPAAASTPAGSATPGPAASPGAVPMGGAPGMAGGGGSPSGGGSPGSRPSPSPSTDTRPPARDPLTRPESQPPSTRPGRTDTTPANGGTRPRPADPPTAPRPDGPTPAARPDPASTVPPPRTADPATPAGTQRPDGAAPAARPDPASTPTEQPSPTGGTPPRTDSPSSSLAGDSVPPRGSEGDGRTPQQDGDPAPRSRGDDDAGTQDPQRTPGDSVKDSPETRRLKRETLDWSNYYLREGQAIRRTTTPDADGHVHPPLAWNAERGGWDPLPDRPVVRAQYVEPQPVSQSATPERRAELQGLIDQRSEAIERAREAAENYKNDSSPENFEERRQAFEEQTGLGEDLGENAARDAFADLLRDRYGDREVQVEQLFPRPDADGEPARTARSGEFDQVYRVTDPETGEVRHYVIEAKGPSAQLGSRIGEGGFSYQQGHPAYVDSLLDAMEQRGGDDADLAYALRDALDDGQLEYHYARAKVGIDDDGNPYYAGYERRQFDLSGETTDGGGAPPQDGDGPRHRESAESTDDPGTADQQDTGAPEGLPSHLGDVYRNSEATPAGRSFYGADDAPMRDLAQRVPPDPDRFVVDAHGDADGVIVDGRRLGVDDVADLIRNDPNWNGREVMLLSCDTAGGTFAEQLAARLGVPVTAPHGLAWSDADGNVYASSGTTGPDGRTLPDLPPNGGWTTHHPNGDTTPSGTAGHAPGHPVTTPPDTARTPAASRGPGQQPDTPTPPTPSPETPGDARAPASPGATSNARSDSGSWTPAAAPSSTGTDPRADAGPRDPRAASVPESNAGQPTLSDPRAPSHSPTPTAPAAGRAGEGTAAEQRPDSRTPAATTPSDTGADPRAGSRTASGPESTTGQRTPSDPRVPASAPSSVATTAPSGPEGTAGQRTPADVRTPSSGMPGDPRVSSGSPTPTGSAAPAGGRASEGGVAGQRTDSRAPAGTPGDPGVAGSGSPGDPRVAASSGVGADSRGDAGSRTSADSRDVADPRAASDPGGVAGQRTSGDSRTSTGAPGDARASSSGTPADPRVAGSGAAVDSRLAGDSSSGGEPRAPGEPGVGADTRGGETPAGRSLHDDPALRERARRVAADPRRFVLDGPGDRDGLAPGGRRLRPEEAARLIRNDPNWNGREVMLLADNVGGGEYGRRLAQELGVRVVSPTGPVRVDENGQVSSSGWTAADPPPADPAPGQVGPDGVRRFDSDAEGDAYGENHLGHVFDGLPPQLQQALHWYTVQSMPNPFLRPGADLPGYLNRIENEHRAAWELARMNGGYVPRTADLHRLWSNPGLSPQQRALLQHILSFPNPEHRIAGLVQSSQQREFLAQYLGGPPTVDAFNQRIAELDQALNQPLPEPIQVERGLHDVSFMRLADGTPLGSRDPALLVGSTQTEPAYMSTSLGRDPATVDGNPFSYHMHIDLPPGSRGVWMGHDSAYPDQRELILPRGTRYEITSVEYRGVDERGRPVYDIRATAIPPGPPPGTVAARGGELASSPSEGDANHGAEPPSEAARRPDDTVRRVMDDPQVQRMLERAGEPLGSDLRRRLEEDLPHHPELARIVAGDGLNALETSLRESLLSRPKTLNSLLGHPEAVGILEQAVADVERRGPEAILDGTGPKAEPTPLTDAQREISERLAGEVQEGRRPGEDRNPRVAPSQPDFDPSQVDPANGRNDPYLNSYLDGLYQRMRESVPALRALVHDPALGGEPHMRPGEKDRVRALDKIMGDYGGDASRLNDLLGAKIQFDTVADLYRALDGLRSVAARHGIEIVSFKDRMLNPVPSGYRDVQLTVRMPNGHIGELRLHLKSIDEVAAYEHALYEVRRDLPNAAEEQNRPLTPEEDALDRAINERVIGRFKDALDRALQDVPPPGPRDGGPGADLSGRPAGPARPPAASQYGWYQDAPSPQHAAEPSHQAEAPAGQHVPADLPEHLRDVFRDSTSTLAGRAFYGPGEDGMRDLARRVPADPRRFVVDAHGDPDGVRVGGRRLSVDDVAALIRNDPNWNGREVMLLSCRTGEGDFAAELSRRLGVPVLAPHGLAWSDSDGNVFASSAERGPDGSPQPTWPPNGSWTAHHPNGTTTPAGHDGYPSDPPEGQDAGPRTDLAARAAPSQDDPPPLITGPDGRLHREGDPETTFRTPDGRLHFDGDDPGTFRNELTQQLQDEKTGRFVKDKFRERPYDFEAVVADGPHDHTPSDEAKRRLDELAAQRAKVEAEKDALRAQIDALPGIAGFPKKEDGGNLYGIERIHDLGQKKLRDTLESAAQAVRNNTALDPQRRAALIDDLDRLSDLARQYTAKNKELVRLSERLGMVAAIDFATNAAGGVRLTPLVDDEPGVPGTLDVTAALTRDPPRLTVVEAKGVGSDLGGRLVDGGKKAEQGTPEYLAWVLERDPDLKAALRDRPDLREALQKALDNGTLQVEYYTVHSDEAGNVKWSRFDLTRGGAPFVPRRVAGLRPVVG
ncbi:ADP-ribosyltransferase [Actinomadura sp. NBRC 104412]|uniref:WXG100-like domain-containing protein n=1 Tax=Actinomadura sp. NBRC 104412 TaxID=3032203 RepID=UPI0025523B00|nr:ADP-ribosyltransferase [Actinomadura sp. NBRC 104412]